MRDVYDEYESEENGRDQIERETLFMRYRVYLDCADDGKGGDITRNGKPLKTFQEWLES